MYRYMRCPRCLHAPTTALPPSLPLLHLSVVLICFFFPMNELPTPMPTPTLANQAFFALYFTCKHR